MGNLFMGNFSFHSELQNLWANPKFHESWQILILIQVAKLMGKSNPIVSCKTNRMQSGASVTWSICKVLTSSLNYRRNLTRDSSRKDQALSKEAIWADASQSILSTATYVLYWVSWVYMVASMVTRKFLLGPFTGHCSKLSSVTCISKISVEYCTINVYAYDVTRTLRVPALRLELWGGLNMYFLSLDVTWLDDLSLLQIEWKRAPICIWFAHKFCSLEWNGISPYV